MTTSTDAAVCSVLALVARGKVARLNLESVGWVWAHREPKLGSRGGFTSETVGYLDALLHRDIILVHGHHVRLTGTGATLVRSYFDPRLHPYLGV